MLPPRQPTGSHLRTFEAIFRHPAAHDLAWRDVHSLLRHLCQVVEEPNGNLVATRNGQSLVLPTPRTKHVAETAKLMELRHFILRSETPRAESDPTDTHWLLVIDHHEARIFRSEMREARPQRILSQEPGDYFRHGRDSKKFSRGQEKLDPDAFFEPVSKALQDAGKILVFGTGRGASAELEKFIAWLKHHQPDLARRIIGSQVVDENHLTEPELLAKAREFYARPAAPLLTAS